MASLNKTPLLSAMDGKNLQKPFRKTQYFATFTASLVTFSIGMILSYLSPASYQIRNASGLASVNESESRVNFFMGSSTTNPHEIISTGNTHEGISTGNPHEGISTAYPHEGISSTNPHEKISAYDPNERISYNNPHEGISSTHPQENPSSRASLEYTQVSDTSITRSKRSNLENENNPNRSTSTEGNTDHPDEMKEATLDSLGTRNLSYVSGTEDGKKTEEITMTVTELAWFSSSVTLGAIAGGLLGILVQKCFGRRGTIMVAVVPAITGWFLIGLSRNIEALIVGRVLTGIFLGAGIASALIFIAEISSPEIRGFLTMFVDLSLSLGKLFVVLLGAFTQWQDLAMAATAPVFLLFICIAFCKESPSCLISKGNYVGARNSLQYYRGPGTDVSVEFENLKTFHIEEAKNKFKCSHVKRPTVYKPLVIVLVVGIFMQLSGIDMLSFNLASIFAQSGSQLSDSGCSIVVICFQVIGNAVSIICIETTGRKKLLIASSIGMTISYVALGGYFFALQVEEAWARQNIFWMPLVAVILFMLSFSIGFGPVPLVLIGEMFPPSVRETATGLACVTIYSTAFFVVFSYDGMQAALTLGGFYWLFAIFCVLAGTFSALFVKETKGKSLAEVSAMFAGGSPTYIALEPTQDPKLPTQNNTSQTQDPKLPTQNNTSHTQDPKLPSQNNTSYTQDPKLPTQNNTSLTQDPKLLTQNNTSYTQDPKLPSQDHTSDTQDPKLPSQNNMSHTQDPKLPSQDHKSTENGSITDRNDADNTNVLKELAANGFIS